MLDGPETHEEAGSASDVVERVVDNNDTMDRLVEVLRKVLVWTRQVPPPLKWWLEHPSVDNTLGTKILRHMKRKGVPVML